ncbi:MAG: hypothetical protein M3010_08330, partial [Candidatus Dormibacteraeota bacterium]|nr:hypothetical protein [Candidatus Dormibacteraeota bacterium]
TLTNAQFSTPIQQDPLKPAHFLIAGQEIMETNSGYDASCAIPTCLLVYTSKLWTQAYDLGAGNSTTALDLVGEDMYAGYCSNCYLVDGAPFATGIATNAVSGKWRKAAHIGLPARDVTSIRMDPGNRSTVYVTLAAYLPRYVPGGRIPDAPDGGTGHVYKSTDAGEHFTDITGNLPNAPANWSLVHDGHLVVATDLGVFVSTDTNGGSYGVLGANLPAVPVMTLRMQPGSNDRMIAATFGRGVYSFCFSGASCPASTVPATPTTPAVLDMLPPTASARIAAPAGALAVVAAIALLVLGRRRRRASGHLFEGPA